MRINSIIFKQHFSHKWSKNPFACVKNEKNNDPVFVFLFSFYEKLSIHVTSATSLIAPLFFAKKCLQPRNVCFRLIFVSYNILYTILIAHHFSPPVSSSIFFSCQLTMQFDLICDTFFVIFLCWTHCNYFHNTTQSLRMGKMSSFAWKAIKNTQHINILSGNM